jgi:sporulation protein YlmC with PRC-barrel domain
MPLRLLVTKPLLVKSIVGRRVVSRDGHTIGQVYDFSIRKGTVNGLLVGREKFKFYDIINLVKVFEFLKQQRIRGLPERKFIAWSSVMRYENDFILKQSKRDVKFAKPKGTFVVKDILDEQIADRRGRLLGRVDEVQFVYNLNENIIKIIGIVTGPGVLLSRLGIKKVPGIKKFKNIIPWKYVKKISRTPPTQIILNV